jgi:hypothetical protein
MSRLSISKQDTLNSAPGGSCARVKHAIMILSALEKNGVYFCLQESLQMETKIHKKWNCF